MKKGLVGLVILGAIAGSVAYKLKKNQQEKEILDDELDILTTHLDEEDEESTDANEESDCSESCEMTNECCCDDSCETVEEIKMFEIEVEPEDVSNDCINEVDDDILIPEQISEAFKEELDADSDKTISKLEEEEDTLEEERPIMHIIDFKSIEDMESFKTVVIEKGYVVTRSENPFQLNVLHIAPINRGELLANVYYLANQAIQHNATYQGWQSRKVL